VFRLILSTSIWLFVPDLDGYEFSIVSLDGHQWFFEAATSEVRFMDLVNFSKAEVIYLLYCCSEIYL